MEIIKNDKTYSYRIPPYNFYDYVKLTNILSDLNIEDEECRISSRYCYIFSKKKISTKLKKYFKDRVTYDYKDHYNRYIYTIELLNYEEFLESKQRIHDQLLAENLIDH